MADGVKRESGGIGWRLARRWGAVTAVARLTRKLHSSVLFDKDSYQVQRQRTFATRLLACLDFVLTGSRLGIAAGPLLVSMPSAVGRPAGVGAAGRWATLILEAGFPSSRHPLLDAEWYATRIPEAATWPGGALAHYTQRGRFDGARLGPRDSGSVDLVVAGASVLQPDGDMPGQARDRGALGTGVAGLVAADPRSEPGQALGELLDGGVDRCGVVLSADATGEERLTAFALAHADERVMVVDDAEVPAVAAECSAAMVRTAPLHVARGSHERLLEAVSEGDCAAAVPVILETDDTVREAGRDADGTRLLAGLPWADAIRAGDRRVAGAGALLVALGPAAIARYVTRGRLRESIEATLTRSADEGMAVHVIAEASAGLVSLSLEATAKRPPMAAPADTGKIRWAIKSPHPAGPRRETWGDWHFAKPLANALEGLGYEVSVDPFHSWTRPSARFDDVTVTIRGLRRYAPQADQVNALWVISHPELVTDEELADFDIVAAASRSWARAHTTAQREVLALLQCTDADAFQPDAGAPGTGYPLLFVGNSRSAPRPLIDAAGASRPELRVIGGGWDGRLPDGVVVAPHVPNEELPALYRSAGVVLNDHWATMAAEGFISNRLFDLTAAGARWISDPVDGLQDVLPTARTASDATELAALLDGAPGTLPTDAEVMAASAMVRAEHTFAARARQLAAAVEQVRAARQRATD